MVSRSGNCAVLILLAGLLSFGALVQSAGPLLKFERAILQAKEGTVLSFQLDAVGLFFTDFFVEVEIFPGSATKLNDYAIDNDFLASRTLANFTLGQIKSAPIDVILIDNDAWEPREYFTIRIVIPRGVEAMLGSPSTLTVNINDDDEVDISFMTSSVSVIENAGVVELQLLSKQVYTSPFEVNVNCFEVLPVQARVSDVERNGTDVYPRVYTVSFDSVNHPESESSRVTMNIVDDLVTEPSEVFICLILRPIGGSGIVVKDPDTLTVTILDDDVLEVSFEESEYAGDEGEIISIRLKASRNFVRPFRVTIFPSTLSIDHPQKAAEATIVDDYTDPGSAEANRGVVEFSAAHGTLSSPLELMLPRNGKVERKEYFQLNFVFEEDSTLQLDLVKGTPSAVLVAIEDADRMFIRFQFPLYRVRESIGTVEIFLEVVQENPDQPGTYLPADHAAGFEVVMATTGVSAQAPSDYGSQVSSVRFQPGAQFSTPFTLTVVDDGVSECPEELEVVFTVPEAWRDRVIVLESDTATVQITDDDESRISFTVNTVESTEGRDSSFQLMVQADNDFQEDQSVRITASDGSAMFAQDYIFTPSVITLPAGQLIFRPPITFAIVDDSVAELMESVSLSIIVPPSTAICRGTHGENATVLVNIEDDDFVFIRVVEQSFEVDEDGDFISFQLEVVNGTVFTPFSVNVQPRESVPVSATYARDFSDLGATTVASFGLGSFLSSTTDVNILDDDISDCDETFQVDVSLVSEMRGIVLLPPTTLEVLIRENDESVLSFTEAVAITTEGLDDPVLMFHIESSRVFERDQAIKIATVDGSATSGSDFQLLTPTVKLHAGNRKSRPVRVRILNDDIVEDVEMFQCVIELSQLQTECGVTLGDATLDVTIDDDDTVFLKLDLRQIPSSIVEGKGAAVVQLEVESGTVFFPISVFVTVNEIRPIKKFAREFLDFYVFGDENEAKFERFDTKSTTAEIRTVDNLLCEGDEDYEIVVHVNQSRVALVGSTALNVTIVDDDTANCFPPVVISFKHDSERIIERGRSYEVLVHRIGRLRKPIRLDVKAETLTAVQDEDFEMSTSSITFTKTTSEYEEVPIHYTVKHRDGAEPREAFKILLDVPRTENFIARQTEVTIIVIDKS